MWGIEEVQCPSLHSIHSIFGLMQTCGHADTVDKCMQEVMILLCSSSGIFKILHPMLTVFKVDLPGFK
jgi:hypothetical protein